MDVDVASRWSENGFVETVFEFKMTRDHVHKKLPYNKRPPLPSVLKADIFSFLSSPFLAPSSLSMQSQDIASSGFSLPTNDMVDSSSSSGAPEHLHDHAMGHSAADMPTMSSMFPLPSNSLSHQPQEWFPASMSQSQSQSQGHSASSSSASAAPNTDWVYTYVNSGQGYSSSSNPNGMPSPTPSPPQEHSSSSNPNGMFRTPPPSQGRSNSYSSSSMLPRPAVYLLDHSNTNQVSSPTESDVSRSSVSDGSIISHSSAVELCQMFSNHSTVFNPTPEDKVIQDRVFEGMLSLVSADPFRHSKLTISNTRKLQAQERVIMNHDEALSIHDKALSIGTSSFLECPFLFLLCLFYFA